MKQTRIVVADPRRIFRSGVNKLLAREGDFIVFEAATFDELTEVIERDCPELILIDLALPPTGGIEAVWHLSRRCSTSIVVWGLDPSREQVLAAARAGADGILRKEISAAGLVRALRGIAHGEAPVARDLVSVLLEALHVVDQRTHAISRTACLSSREREVLQLIAHGARNRQIAVELAISEFTVKRHVQNILQKLESPSRRVAAGLYCAAFGVPEIPAGAERA